MNVKITFNNEIFKIKNIDDIGNTKIRFLHTSKSDDKVSDAVLVASGMTGIIGKTEITGEV